MDITGENVRLLMRLGYWSVWHGLFAEASALFTGAQAARPASDVPLVGQAVLAMAMHQPAAAVALLQPLAKSGTQLSELGEAHLGCALCLADQEAAGREILQRLGLHAKNPAARQMAATLAAMPTTQLKPNLPNLL
jgi:hypothetical protein